MMKEPLELEQKQQASSHPVAQPLIGADVKPLRQALGHFLVVDNDVLVGEWPRILTTIMRYLSVMATIFCSRTLNLAVFVSGLMHLPVR
jgi:hypothetical protein